jgi:acyl-coenzyme A synthetase/AMP-(fatty) acid ligase
VSESIKKLVCILAERGPMRAGQLGMEMWGRDADIVRPENNALTMHCRAAGKLLARAEREGLVRSYQRGPAKLWRVARKVGAG